MPGSSLVFWRPHPTDSDSTLPETDTYVYLLG
jgi:hypothetical protein